MSGSSGMRNLPFLRRGFLGGGRRKGERTLLVLEFELMYVSTVEQIFQGIGGFLEALVGFGITLLRVVQVFTDFVKRFTEVLEMFAQTVEIRAQALRVFLNLHAPQPHGDDGQVRIERVRGNRNDLF